MIGYYRLLFLLSRIVEKYPTCFIDEKLSLMIKYHIIYFKLLIIKITVQILCVYIYIYILLVIC